MPSATDRRKGGSCLDCLILTTPPSAFSRRGPARGAAHAEVLNAQAQHLPRS